MVPIQNLEEDYVISKDGDPAPSQLCLCKEQTVPWFL